MKQLFVFTLFLLLLVISSDSDEEIIVENPSRNDMFIAVGITTFAGLAAFIGAFSVFCIKKDQIIMIPTSLGFSAGILIYLSFVNLIPESIEQFNDSQNNQSQSLSHFYTLLCVIFGILFTLLMEYIFKFIGVNLHGHADDSNSHMHQNGNVQEQQNILSINITPNDGNENNSTSTIEDSSSDNNKTISQPKLSSTISYSIALAIILHHFPEGIATFISLYHNLEFGLLIAFGLAIHDIPAGICIAVPTYFSTGSRLKPFLLCLIAASVYPIGAFVGWCIIVNTSNTFINIFMGILFGIIAGIMLYIAFIELLPTSIITAYNYENKNMLNISIILLFIGFLIMDVSNILLDQVGHSH